MSLPSATLLLVVPCGCSFLRPAPNPTPAERAACEQRLETVYDAIQRARRAPSDEAFEAWSSAAAEAEAAQRACELVGGDDEERADLWRLGTLEGMREALERDVEAGAP